MAETKLTKLLSKLKLPTEGTYSEDNCYTIDLEDSDDFSKVQSRLDNSDEVTADEDLSIILDNVVYSVYDTEDEEYSISLIGNLEDDTYKIVIEENQ